MRTARFRLASLAWFSMCCFCSIRAKAQSSTEELGTIPPPSPGILVGQTEDAALRISARIQTRFSLEEQRGTFDRLFEIRRARVKFKGYVWGKNNRFYLQLGLSPKDMTGGMIAQPGSPRHVPVRDARIEFHQLPWAVVYVGQMKVPFSRERLVSDAYLDMMERSIVNEEFNMDRDIGVQLSSNEIGAGFGYALGVFSGQGRNLYEANRLGASVVSRLTYQPLAPVDTKTEGDLQRSDTLGIAFGVAYAAQWGAPGEQGVHGVANDQGRIQLQLGTVDGVLKWQGLSVEGAWMMRRGWRTATDLDQPYARDGMGWLVQCGFVLPRSRWELVGRVARVTPWMRSSTSARSVGWTPKTEVRAGINYYLRGHDLKLELDAGHEWIGTGPRFLQRQDLRLQVQMAL